MSDRTFSILMALIFIFILLIGCLAMASYWDNIEQRKQEEQQGDFEISDKEVDT